MITADGGWRRGKAAAAEANGRRGAGKSRRRSRSASCSDRGGNEAVDMKPGRDFWWHELMAKASADCPADAARQRSAALHPLHQRLDRQAQGHQAHDGRLQPVREEDVRVGLRSSRRGRLLVYGRLRLGHRAQLRRLRPAVGRRDGADVRRCAESARTKAASGSSSRSIKVTIFYTAPTAIRAFIKWGDHHVDEARSVEPAAAGHRRRRDQSRSLDVVSPHDRRRALPDRRYLVADRNRRHHDEPAAGRDSPRSRAVAPSRCRASCRRSSIRRGKPVAQGPGRLAGDDASRGPACCAASGATTSATRKSVLEQSAAQVSGRRQCPLRRRRLLLDHGPHRRRAQRLRPSAEHDRDRKRARVSHPQVAEAAAVGRPDELKGEAVAVFVTLKDGRAERSAARRS